MRKKVTFLVSAVVRQGPVNQLLGLLRHLPSLGFECEVLTIKAHDDVKLRTEMLDCGVPVRRLDGTTLYEHGRSLASRTHQPNVAAVISVGVRADALNALFGPRGRRFSIKHEVAFSPWRGGRLAGLALRSAHLMVLGCVDLIICVSETVRYSLPSALRGRAVVIPNGVQTEFYRAPLPSEREEARRRIAAAPSDFVVLFVGSFDFNKRPHLIIEPLLRLLDRGQRVQLVLAGEGPLRFALEHAIAAGCPAQLLGFREDVRELLWGGDVLVLPSAHEGMPMAVIEALSCNVPVVLSDIGAHREVLRGCASCGVLVDPENVHAFAAAIELVARDVDKFKPRVTAEHRFSAAKMAEAYAILFDRHVADGAECF